MNINDAVIEMQKVCAEFDLITEKRLQLAARREILMESISEYLEELMQDEY
jgi:hypothetical protein|tara:strand:- start:1262 stop:1414 length:153 start_codon:yes stop_codon:yes gene_type:complete